MKVNIENHQSGKLHASGFCQTLQGTAQRSTPRDRQRRFIHIGLLAILFFVVIQAPAQVITLDSLLGLIDKQNPMLQEFDNRVKALNAYTAGAKSWMARSTPNVARTIQSHGPLNMRFTSNFHQSRVGMW